MYNISASPSHIDVGLRQQIRLAPVAARPRTTLDCHDDCPPDCATTTVSSVPRATRGYGLSRLECRYLAKMDCSQGRHVGSRIPSRGHTTTRCAGASSGGRYLRVRCSVFRDDVGVTCSIPVANTWIGASMNMLEGILELCALSRHWVKPRALAEVSVHGSEEGFSIVRAREAFSFEHHRADRKAIVVDGHDRMTLRTGTIAWN